AELLPGVGSLVELDTLAVLCKTVASGVDGSTVAVITTVCVEPAATTPKLVEPDQELLEPPSTTAVAPVRPVGRVSVTETACASEGPAFCTVNVYVSW